MAETKEEMQYTASPLEALPFDELTGEWAVYAEHEKSGGKMTAICNGPNAEGNAKLYAASPDLLDACEAALKLRELENSILTNDAADTSQRQAWREEARDIETKLRDAIQKALNRE